MPLQLNLLGLDLPFPTAPAERSTNALRRYPDVSGRVLCQEAKLLGLAGERLVDSVLLRHGLVPLALPEVFPIDRVILHPERLLGLQIKTCNRADPSGAFSFDVKRGYGRSPAGARRYDQLDFDMLALVVLPFNAVFFTVENRNSHRIRASEMVRLQRSPRESLDLALASLGLDEAPAPALQSHEPELSA